jgi:hypothetical protein
MPCSGITCFCTRRKSNNHIPLSDIMNLSIHGGYLPPIDGFQRITQDMPLRMFAGAFLDIAGVRFVSQFPERYTHRL